MSGAISNSSLSMQIRKDRDVNDFPSLCCVHTVHCITFFTSDPYKYPVPFHCNMLEYKKQRPPVDHLRKGMTDGGWEINSVEMGIKPPVPGVNQSC